MAFPEDFLEDENDETGPKKSKKQKAEEALQKRIEKYKEYQKLPQFIFQDRVKITGGFFDGFYGFIYSELDITKNPVEGTRDYVVISYQVNVYRGEENTDSFRKETRVVETEYLSKVEEEDIEDVAQ